MLEILFLFGFSLHNVEEALWLPEWSKHAKRFHTPVEPGIFRFALIVVTTEAFLLTALRFGFPSPITLLLFHGFVLMMVFNVFFPHVAATIALRRYAPGLLTGLLLNLPIGLFLTIRSGLPLPMLLTATIGVSAVTLLLINLCFRFGSRLMPR